MRGFGDLEGAIMERYRATVGRGEYTGDLMGQALAAGADRAAAFRRFAEQVTPTEAERLCEALEQASRAGGQR